MPKIISVHSWKSPQYGFIISDVLTDQGDMKIYETQLITPKESLKPGNYIFFCSQVCPKNGGEICSENPLLKNRKCGGQFFYVLEKNILNGKQQR